MRFVLRLNTLSLGNRRKAQQQQQQHINSSRRQLVTELEANHNNVQKEMRDVAGLGSTVLVLTLIVVCYIATQWSVLSDSVCNSVLHTYRLKCIKRYIQQCIVYV